MTYTPRTFTKGGKTQVAETIEEDVQLLWEGWTPSTPYVTPRTQLPAHLNDLDALSATFATKPYIALPQIVGHMGGIAVYPEHSVEGHQACADQGFAVDLDVRAGLGGVPLVIHDSTYTRTMVNVRNAAGTELVNVSDATEAQHLAGAIRPAAGGSKFGKPASLDYYLDTFGGQVPIALETKDTGAAFAQVIIDKIVARGLQKAVFLNSAYYDQVQMFRAAGLRVMFVTNHTDPAQTPAEAAPASLAAAGIEAVSFTPGIITGAAFVNTYHDAGIKVGTYATHSKYDYDRLISYGVDHFWADEPWMATARYPAVARHRWDDGLGRPNRAYFRMATDPTKLVWKVRSEVPCVELQDASNFASSWAGFYPLSELGTGPLAGTYRFKAKFLAPLPSQAADVSGRWFMLHLGHQPTNDNSPFGNGYAFENGSTSQQTLDANKRGYSFRILRSGAMYINWWNFGTGLDIANNTAAMPAAPFAAAGAASTTDLEFEIVITASTLVLRCLTAGFITETTTVAHNGWRGNNARWTLGVNGAGIDFSDYRANRS